MKYFKTYQMYLDESSNSDYILKYDTPLRFPVQPFVVFMLNTEYRHLIENHSGIDSAFDILINANENQIEEFIESLNESELEYLDESVPQSAIQKIKDKGNAIRIQHKLKRLNAAKAAQATAKPKVGLLKTGANKAKGLLTKAVSIFKRK